MPVPDMWGKIKPEWVQANEMPRMRAVKNLLCRYQMDAGASVHPEGPSMKRGGKG
jgi:hypothetical protein